MENLKNRPPLGSVGRNLPIGRKFRFRLEVGFRVEAIVRHLVRLTLQIR